MVKILFVMWQVLAPPATAAGFESLEIGYIYVRTARYCSWIGDAKRVSIEASQRGEVFGETLFQTLKDEGRCFESPKNVSFTVLRSIASYPSVEKFDKKGKPIKLTVAGVLLDDGKRCGTAFLLSKIPITGTPTQ